MRARQLLLISAASLALGCKARADLSGNRSTQHAPAEERRPTEDSEGMEAYLLDPNGTWQVEGSDQKFSVFRADNETVLTMSAERADRLIWIEMQPDERSRELVGKLYEASCGATTDVRARPKNAASVALTLGTSDPSCPASTSLPRLSSLKKIDGKLMPLIATPFSGSWESSGTAGTDANFQIFQSPRNSLVLHGVLRSGRDVLGYGRYEATTSNQLLFVGEGVQLYDGCAAKFRVRMRAVDLNRIEQTNEGDGSCGLDASVRRFDLTRVP